MSEIYERPETEERVSFPEDFPKFKNIVESAASYLRGNYDSINYFQDNNLEMFDEPENDHYYVSRFIIRRVGLVCYGVVLDVTDKGTVQIHTFFGQRPHPAGYRHQYTSLFITEFTEEMIKQLFKQLIDDGEVMNRRKEMEQR